MAGFFNGITPRFWPHGGNNKGLTASTSTSVTSQSRQVLPAAFPLASSTTNVSPLPSTPSLSQSNDFATTIPDLPRPLPSWLNPAYAKHIVKGNLMTLSSKPKTVEQGEWLAHQTVEHYRLLWNFVRVIIETDDSRRPICTCPKMSAGKYSYTWINNSSEPIELPAHEYITLVGRWISRKIDDPELFPTDPSTASYAHHPGLASQNPTLASLSSGSDDWIGKRSGFPENFASTCQTIFQQMFRIYSHLYWEHFIDPFYHLNLEKQLNSCFSHFILTAMSLDMLKPNDMESMQPLIDLWAANDTFPLDSKPYQTANVKRGTQLLHHNITPHAI